MTATARENYRQQMEARRMADLSGPSHDHLDGCGSFLKYPFADAVQQLGRTFDYAFEWCSGMGEIGTELLKRGLCKRLCLADINPEAIAVASERVRSEGLQDKVDLFVSDNMDNIPPSLRFDLVVANPPNYCNIQKAHPLGNLMYNDLRPNDRGWHIHRKFYKTIRPYLKPDAVMLISEVEPYKKEVFIPPLLDSLGPYDVRDQVPIESFGQMTRENDIRLVDTRFFYDIGGVQLYLLKMVPGQSARMAR